MRTLMSLMAAGLVLVSATPAEARSRGGDGYIFENKQWEITSFSVEIRQYESLYDLQREAEKHGIVPDMGNVFAAFMSMNKTRKHCIIHIYNPEKKYMPEQYGHELAHCAFGNFHRSR